MALVFVSYARADDTQHRKTLTDFLEDRGHEVFVDEHSVMGGEEWESAIEQGLRQSAAVVVVHTRKWQQSLWGFYEATRATYLGKTVIPLLFDDADVGQPVSRYQWVDFNDASTDGRQRSLETLSVALDRHGIVPDGSSYGGAGNPYRGFESYRCSDESLFFGRKLSRGKNPSDEQRMVSLVERLGRDQTLGFVTGPSGSGKSSLLAAGLVPALRRAFGRWVVPEPVIIRTDPFTELADQLVADLPLTEVLPNLADNAIQRADDLAERFANPLPSQFPLTEIALALSRHENQREARLVIIIDQFEQVLAAPSERTQQFVEFLHREASSGGFYAPIVVLSMRFDYLDRFTELFPDIPIERENLEVVRPLDRDALARVIEGPASRRLVGVKTDLLQRLIEQTAQTTSLPLLSYTLAKMFDIRQDAAELSLTHYEAVGGIEGVVDEVATRLYRPDDPRLTEDQHRKIRSAFVNLATHSSDQQRPWVRRPLPWSSVDDSIKPILERFVGDEARLLTLTDASDRSPYLEVTHEALFTSWETLRQWLEAHREQMTLRDELAIAAQRWREAGGDLLTGGRLARAIDLRNDKAFSLPPETVELIDQSEAEARRIQDQQLDQERRTAQRFKQAARRFRFIALAAALAFTAASGFAWLAGQRADEASEAQNRAEQQAAEASSARSLAERRALEAAEATALTRKRANEAELALSAQELADLNPSLALAISAEMIGIRQPPAPLATQTRATMYQAVVGGQPIGLPLEGHTEPVWSVDFSHDGTLLASAGLDGTIRLWDPSNGEAIGLLEGGHEGWVLGVAFDRQGQLLASAGLDNTVRLWDPATNELVGPPLEGHTGPVYNVAFNPAGTMLASVSKDESVRLWDTATGEAIAELKGHEGPVRAVTFSNDGSLLASSGEDAIRLWDPATGRPLGRPFGQGYGSTRAVVFSPDDSVLASATTGNIVALWDPATGAAVGEPMKGHTSAVRSVDFSPDGTLLVSAGHDGTLRSWDPATTRPAGPVLEGHAGSIWSVAFSPDGALLATAGDDTTVRLWDAATDQPIGRPLLGHEGWVMSVAFNPDSTLLASASLDGTIHLRNPQTGRLVGEPLVGHTSEVVSLAFSPAGDLLASAGADATVRLWNPSTGEAVGEPLEGHADQVLSVAFNSEGTLLASASFDNTIRLWNPQTGQPIGQPLEGDTEWIGSVAFNPAGTLLASGGADHLIRLWDPTTGQELVNPLEGHEGPVRRVAFSPDGALLASASADATVRFWDPATGEPIGQPLQDGTSALWDLAFGPDGTVLATAGDDTMIRLWDVATGEAAGQPLQGHKDPVRSVAFNTEGTLLASSGNDLSVRLWDQRLTADQACRYAEPYVTRQQLQAELDRVDRKVEACDSFVDTLPHPDFDYETDTWRE